MPGQYLRLVEMDEYVDEGCDLAPRCLECPLPACKYDLGRKQGASVLKEQEIARHLAAGLSVDETAAAMGMSRRSVYRLKEKAAKRVRAEQ